jgi:hypothetical protein
MKNVQFKKRFIFLILVFFLINNIQANENNPELDFDGIKLPKNGVKVDYYHDVRNLKIESDIGYITYIIDNKVYTIKDIKKGSNFIIVNGKIIDAEIITSTEQEININGNNIKIAKDKKLYYKDGKIIEGEFELLKDGNYNLGNRVIELPKDTKIKIENGKAIIQLPKNNKIKAPVKIDKDMPDDLTYEFTTESDSSIEFNGKVLTSVNKESFPTLYFDNKFEGFYIESEANVDNIDIGTIGIVKKMYFFDNIIPEGFDSAALLYGTDTLSIIAMGSSNSASVWFKKGNRFIDVNEEKIVMQARAGIYNKDMELIHSADSRIDIIKKQGEITKVQIQGYYTIINGNNVVQYDPVFKSPRITKQNNNDKSLILRISSKDPTGNIIKYKENVKTNNGMVVKDLEVNWELFLDANNGFFIARGNEIDVVSKINFYTLDGENLEKLRTLSIDKQISVLSGTREEMLSILSKIELSKINENIQFGKHAVTKPHQAKYRSKMMNDIMSHEAPGDSNSYGDLVTTAHEATHGLNAYIRNHYGSGTGKVNGFYLGNGNYQILHEPQGVKLSDVAGKVPSQLRSHHSYGLYLQEQQRYWQNEPLYVLDELTAYTNGAIVGLESGARRSLNVPEFMAYSLALGRVIEQKNPNYYNSKKGEEFRNFLGYSLRRAMNAHSAQVQRTKGRTHADAQKIFSEMTNQELRDYSYRTFGKHWTNQVLGF